MEYLAEVKEIYAIIETGGKQYKVTPSQSIDVERLDVTKGNTIELDKVLLIADGEKVTLGTPTINGAKVIATSQGDSKDKKVIVFRYKSKVRYRKKTGHRQTLTRLTIDKIIGTEGLPGETKGETKRVRRRKKEVTESGT